MARSCSDCGVRDSALCGSLTDDELATLARLGSQRRLARGATLVRAGDASLVCANLQSGAMKIASQSADGGEAIVGLLYPGDFVGRPFAAESDHDIVALTDVELCVFPRATFEQALTDHKRMERLLLERTLEALGEARLWLARVGRASATARLAGCLDDMARRLVAVNDCQRAAAPPVAAAAFDLPLSRGEIADLLGLTIETVSRQMTRLRAAGIIDLPGGRAIVVRDRAGLAALAADGG